jgi:hypothetical protein
VRRTDNASAFVARAEARSRRRSLIGLGLLAGITVGLAVTALSGAIRTSTALDRLRDREDAADAVVFPSQVGAFQPDWDALAARPEVARIARWGLLFGTVGEGAPEGVPPGPNLVFTSIDGTYLGDMDRPLVVEGRMYDPHADDEVVIDENLEGVEVGDVIPFRAFGVEQAPEETEATGPSTELHVVGRVRTLSQFLFVPDGQVIAGPGYMEQHADEVQVVENGNVQTRHGAADMDDLERSVDAVLADGAPVLDTHESSRRVDTTTHVEWIALLILGAVILLAGVALVGQAVVQSALASTDELRTLQALGMTRSDVVVTVTRTHVPAVAAAMVSAAVVAAVVATVASIWFPIGMAARVDPDRGVRVTWWLLVAGVLFVGAALAATVAWASRHGTRARPPSPALARLLAWVRRWAPLPVGLGTTMALTPGRGSSRVPVRQALVGAAAGVIGIVATITFSAGLADTRDHPERAGVTWDAAGHVRPNDLTPRSADAGLTDAVAGTEGVADVALVDRQVLDVDGVGTPAFAIQAPDGHETSIALSVTSGRPPEAGDEVALGPAAADRSDVGVGDTVEIGEGGDYRVVGIALFPSDVHATFDDGAWLSPDAYQELVPPVDPDALSYPERSVVVRFDRDVSVDDGLAALQETVGDRFDDLGEVEVPAELTNLDNVRRLPQLLAVFLVLLAVSALGHVLATAARRRRHDFAVLRALGMRRASARAVLNVQGTVIGLVGLVVGIPVGIVVGRIGWGIVAESVPIAVVRPVAFVAVAALVPLALLLANGLAAWPGHRVARLHPAEVLRAE